LILTSAGGLEAVTSSSRELGQAQAWTKANFSSAGPRVQLPPFSFTYNGQPSSELLKEWRFQVGSESRQGTRRQQSYTFIDPTTGLEVTCELTQYDDFPAAEWVLSFKNTGHKPSPILQDVHALNIRFQSEGSQFVLHRALGSYGQPTDFAPVDQTLEPGRQVLLAPVGGRSSNTNALPFFNIEAPAAGSCRESGADTPLQGRKLCGEGVMIGLGWSGQWAASFLGSAAGIEIGMGMERTHLKLLPGERIQTPRILLLFWQGADQLRGHNLLRSFVLAHHTPRPGGRLPVVPVAHTTWFQFNNGNGVTERNQIDFASLFPKKRIPLDAFWLDAGWFAGGWPYGAGNWFPKPDTFPHGLRPLSDAVHGMGMRFIVWFEPERVSEGTWLYTHHPEPEFRSWAVLLPAE